MHFSKQLIFWCTDFKATASTEMLPWSIKVTFMNLNYQGVMCRAVPGHHCATALLQCSHTCETRVASEGKKRYKRAISHCELWGRGKKSEEEALLPCLQFQFQHNLFYSEVPAPPLPSLLPSRAITHSLGLYTNVESLGIAPI